MDYTSVRVLSPSLSNFEILLCQVSPSFQSQNGWEAEEFVETMVRLQQSFSMVFPCFGSSLLRLSSWYCNQTRSTKRCHGGPAESLGSSGGTLTTKANAVLILPFTYIYTSFCTSISITVLLFIILFLCIYTYMYIYIISNCIQLYFMYNFVNYLEHFCFQHVLRDTAAFLAAAVAANRAAMSAMEARRQLAERKAFFWFPQSILRYIWWYC